MKFNTIKGKIKRILAVTMAVAIVATSVSVNNMIVHAENEIVAQDVESDETTEVKEESKKEVVAEDVKSDDTKTENTKIEEIKTEETKTEEKKSEETKTEETKTEGTKAEDNGTEEEDSNVQDLEKKVVEEETTVSGNAVEDTTVANTVSANEVQTTVSANELQSVRLTQELNGVRIVATAEAGVLPENAVLDAVEITTTKAIETAVEGTVAATEEVEEIKSYDIKITSNGEEVQPEDGAVSITFEGIAVAADEKAAVVYTSDDASKVEKQDTQVSDDAVSFDAEHFSIYNVVIITTNRTGDKLTTFVPNEGYTQLDLKAYFNKKAITEIEVKDESIIEAHLKDGDSDKLQITAKDSDTNRNTQITIKSEEAKKTLTLDVYVSARPAMSSSAFAAAFSDKISSFENGYTDTFKTELKRVNGGDARESQIDSNATQYTDAKGNEYGNRIVAVKNVMGVSEFTGYSFRYETNRTLYYLSIDLAELTGVDNLAINKNIDQLFLVDCYEGGSLTPVQKMMRIAPVGNEGSEKRYWKLVTGTVNNRKTATFLNDDGEVIDFQMFTNASSKATAPSEDDFYTTLGNYASKETADKYSRFLGWTTDGGKTIVTAEEISEKAVNKDITYTAVCETIAHFYVNVNNAWYNLEVGDGNVGVLDDSVYEVYKGKKLTVGNHEFTREALNNLIKTQMPETITMNGVTYQVVPDSLVKEGDGWHIDCTVLTEGQYEVVYVNHAGVAISRALVSSEAEEQEMAPTDVAGYTEVDDTYLYEFQGWERETTDTAAATDKTANKEPVILKATYQLTTIFANVFVLNKDVLGPVTEENLSEIVSGGQGYQKVGQVALKFDQVKDMREDNTKVFVGNDQILSADGYVMEDELDKLGVNGSISQAAIEKLAQTYTNLNFDGYTMDWYIMKNYKATGFHIDGVPVARPIVDTPATGGGAVNPNGGTTPGGTGTTTGGTTTGGTGTTTGGAGTTTTTAATPALTSIPNVPAAQNVVIPDAPVAQAATPDAVNQNVTVQTPGNGTTNTNTTIEDEETAQAAEPNAVAIDEADTVTIPEEAVALAPRYMNDCAIHWIILLLTLCYSIFAMARAFARHRQINEMIDNEDMEIVRTWEIR